MLFENISPWLLWLPVVILAIMALPYVAGPILIKYVQKLRAVPNVVAFDPQVHKPPPDAAYFFEQTTATLQGLGFSLATYALLPDQIPNLHALLALYENRETDDAALAVVMYMVQQGVAQGQSSKSMHVQFSAETPDGVEVSVSNSTEESVFAPVPERRLFQFDGLKSLDLLYQVQQHAFAEVSSGRKQPLPPRDEWLEYVKRDLINEMRQQIDTGYLYLTAAKTGREGQLDENPYASPQEDQYYMPTWKGAILMTWKMLWPVKGIRRHRRARRNQQLLDRWGIGRGAAPAYGNQRFGEPPQ